MQESVSGVLTDSFWLTNYQSERHLLIKGCLFVIHNQCSISFAIHTRMLP